MIRNIALHLSIATSIASLLLLPLIAHSSRLQSLSSPHIDHLLHVMHLSAAGSTPPISVSRDPFAPPASALVDEDRTNVIVRAIAHGPQSVALIDEDGKVRFVAVGDILAGTSVQRIDSQAIVLSNGRTFPITKQP